MADFMPLESVESHQVGEIAGENEPQRFRSVPVVGLVDDSDWPIRQKKFSYFEVKETERSANIARAGVLALFYFYGREDTCLAEMPTLRDELNDLGREVLEQARSLSIHDSGARRASFKKLLAHPLAKGIQNEVEFEWLLCGIVSLALRAARDEGLLKESLVIEDESKVVFQVLWADRMYGPDAVVPDATTVSHFRQFAARWKEREAHFWPIKDDAEAATFNVLRSAWLMRVAAHDMNQMAKRLQDELVVRLGSSPTKAHGSDVLKGDEVGHAPWDRDALAYWSYRVLGKKVSDLDEIWPDHGSDEQHTRSRLDQVSKFLKKLGPIPKRLVNPSTDLFAEGPILLLAEIGRNNSDPDSFVADSIQSVP